MSVTAQAVQELLRDHRLFHSAWQIDNYVVSRSGRTPYGMYKQALRELKARWDSLKLLYVKRVQLSELRDPELTPLQRVESVIARDDTERTIIDTEREFCRFFDHATRLKAHLGELSPARIELLEAELWLHKLRSKIAVELVVHGKVTEDTIEMILSVDPSIRFELLSLANPANVARRTEIIAELANFQPEFDIDRSTKDYDRKELQDALQRFGTGELPRVAQADAPAGAVLVAAPH